MTLRNPREAEICGMSRAELAELLRGGAPVDPATLEDSAWRGVSLGLAPWVEKLTWKKFQKSFHLDRRRGVLRGWNVRVEQDELDAPCTAKVRRGRPWTFGHYRVVPLAGRKTPRPCGTGLLLDYGQGGNAAWDPSSLARDPIVHPDPADRDLLLGWSYLEIGGLVLATPSFFTLRRAGALAHVAEPARG